MGDIDVRERVCEAAVVCVARWGVTKTTLEDVAREAGCGRATIYRAFRGGKAEVLSATLDREIGRALSTVDAAIVAADDDLESVLVAGVSAAAGFLANHEALAYLLRHEPDVLLPWVAFHRLGLLFDLVAAYADPHLARFLPDPERRARAAEWLARVILTYVLDPADGIDLTDPAATRHLLSTYVIPGLRAGSSTSREPAPS